MPVFPLLHLRHPPPETKPASVGRGTLYGYFMCMCVNYLHRVGEERSHAGVEPLQVVPALQKVRMLHVARRAGHPKGTARRTTQTKAKNTKQTERA